MPLAGTTTTLTLTNATDAQFRAWGSAVSAKLLAAGFVQTADTGQINWTTVLAPTAINTIMGYEIWRFDDALQATFPVFFKVEYGSGAATANPSMHFQFGSGSNGTGTLTGNVSLRGQSTQTAYATNPVTCYWCGTNNRFVMVLSAGGVGSTTSNSHVVSFERSVDGAGAVTGEAILFAVKSASTGWNALAWSTTLGNLHPAFETSLGALGPTSGGGTTGLQVAVYPIFFQKGVFLNVGLNMHVYFDASFAAAATQSFTIYGATVRYMAVGGSFVAGTTNSLARSTTAVSVMIRYDA